MANLNKNRSWFEEEKYSHFSYTAVNGIKLIIFYQTRLNSLKILMRNTNKYVLDYTCCRKCMPQQTFYKNAFYQMPVY